MFGPKKLLCISSLTKVTVTETVNQDVCLISKSFVESLVWTKVTVTKNSPCVWLKKVWCISKVTVTEDRKWGHMFGLHPTSILPLEMRWSQTHPSIWYNCVEWWVQDLSAVFEISFHSEQELLTLLNKVWFQGVFGSYFLLYNLINMNILQYVIQ